MRVKTLCIAVVFCSAATIAVGGKHGNPPWFPSLMAFEHYDSGRTHLFEQARFGGLYDGNNEVAIKTAPVTYPTPYNMAYLSPHDIFLYGGGYGNISNATGAFVTKLDPDTLGPIWSNQLINTAETGEWDYPGVLSILNDGFLYVVYGHRLAKLNPEDGTVVDQVDLPTGGASPGDTSYNGFDALPDGTLIAKTLYREQGCQLQGPDVIFKCPDPGNVPPSTLISVDPRTLQVLDQITLPSIVGGRPTTARFHGHDYVYLATPQTAIRYLVADGKFTLDQSWNPGTIYQAGQTLGSAVVVMNDWIVIQSNSSPATAPLSVIAINQGDATRQSSAQPFADAPVPSGLPTSWAPMSVSADPAHNLIYTADSSPGMIGALALTNDRLSTVWTVSQRTTEFLALIGPRSRRVLVTTEIPAGQAPAQNTTDYVVWRDAQTGRELTRTQQLPVMTSGAMIQPYYFKKVFYLGLDGDVLELTAQPARE